MSFTFWFLVAGWSQRFVEHLLGRSLIGPEDEVHWLAGLAVLLLTPITTLVLVTRATSGLQRLTAKR